MAVVSLDGVFGGDASRAVATEPAGRWDGRWSPAGRAPTRRVPAARLSGSVVALFLGFASLVWAVVVASAVWLPADHPSRTASWAFFPGRPWFGGWVRFDGGWYRAIATDGYWYRPGHRSAVAFFPSYPLFMRLGNVVTGSVLIAGIAVTVVSGLLAAVLFVRWATGLVGGRVAWTGVILLLVYPYSLYLYGAVYSDALFLATAIAAFFLLERGHPVLAGFVGVVALAGRPVGVALVLGLIVRAMELRQAAIADPDHTPARTAGAGVLISLAGLVGWCGYLWVRFGDPFVFAATEKAWHQEPGPRTWFKLMFFGDLTRIHTPGRLIIYLAHPIVTVVALALIPVVWRRLGRGYGVYTAVVLLIPTISTSNFWSMGRYTLAAFPCFLAGGLLLADRTVLRRTVMISSSAALCVVAVLYTRGVYVA